jgi:hypothetical protein
MATKKSGKAYTIISENPKMDTSGMAGKPMDYSDMIVEYTPPPMNLGQMMSKKAQVENKKPAVKNG